MRDHRKLKAFGLADALVLNIYSVTKTFPREEQFGLTSQLRRATVSVAANIVEGCARSTEKEYVRFLEIAFASSHEAEYLLSVAGRLDYVPAVQLKELEDQFDHASRTLAALLQSFTR